MSKIGLRRGLLALIALVLLFMGAFAAAVPYIARTALEKTASAELGRQVTVQVASVWRDYARQFGAVVMDTADYQTITGDTRVNDLALWLQPDADLTQVQAAAAAGNEEAQQQLAILAMAPRSLRRRLTEEGTSFRNLVDAERGQLAGQLLENTQMKLEEMALQLGYGDTASFTRAFRRWFGQSPSEYRKASKR